MLPIRIIHIANPVETKLIAKNFLLLSFMCSFLFEHLAYRSRKSSSKSDLVFCTFEYICPDCCSGREYFPHRKCPNTKPENDRKADNIRNICANNLYLLSPIFGRAVITDRSSAFSPSRPLIFVSIADLRRSSSSYRLRTSSRALESDPELPISGSSVSLSLSMIVSHPEFLPTIFALYPI